MPNVKFKYFGDTSKAYTNVLTIASELTIEKSLLDNSLHYYINFNFVFSNKKDKYDKYVGRELALEKFNKYPYKISLGNIVKEITDINSSKELENIKYKLVKPSYKQINESILNYIVKNIDNAPTWFFKWCMKPNMNRSK